MKPPSRQHLPAPQLSRIRTFLFWALAIVWFSEAALWGLQSFSEIWTKVWNMIPPENPQLAAALSMTHAVEAPLKAALGVLAVFALRSRNSSVRTPLFISMALVPPLNMAFQFRAQGFPPGSVMVASVFSIILWGSFLLFREVDQESAGSMVEMPSSRWEGFRNAWFSFNSAVLSCMAIFFLFWPGTALDAILPYLSGLPNIREGELSSLTISNLGVGSHLAALAVVSWIGTLTGRRNPSLRQAIALASTFSAGLMCILPLLRITLEIGGRYAAASLLMIFVPLFAGWLVYTAYSCGIQLKTRQEAYI